MRTKKQNAFLIVLLGLLNALTPFSIDMYLPAFAQIAADFNTTTTKVAFSVSTYFVGFALGQLFYGPLLDYFGRKKPLYIGLAVYVFASIGLANTNSMEWFLALRFLQAVGGCVASVGAMTMARDFFPVEESAKIFSLLMLVLSVSPLLAPTIGGFMVTAWGWRVIFTTLAVIGILNLILTYFFIPNTYKRDASISLNLKAIFLGFKEILKVPDFSIYVFAGSFSFAGLFVYIAGSPSMFMDGFNVSAQVYGIIFAVLAVAMIGGGQLNLWLTKRFKSPQILKVSIFAQTLMSAIFFLGTYFQVFTMEGTVAILFLLLACAGIGFPNAAAIALASFTTNVGSASALMGFLQLGVGSVTSAVVGALNYSGSLPTSVVMFASSATASIILLIGANKKGE